jgi:hypothetical protein
VRLKVVGSHGRSSHAEQDCPRSCIALAGPDLLTGQVAVREQDTERAGGEDWVRAVDQHEPVTFGVA